MDKGNKKRIDEAGNVKDQEASEGLSTTYEQVSDVYMEGTIDGVMNDVNGKDIPLQKTRKS